MRIQQNMRNWLIIAIFAFSSLLNFKIDGRHFFLWLQILFCIYMAVTYKEVVFFPYKSINLFFISILLCTCCSLFSGMPYSWIKAAVVMGIYMIPFYFTASYLFYLLKNDPDNLRIIIKGIKIMCMIQLLWIPLQFAFSHFLDLDLNKILFYDILHMIPTEDGATFIRDWTYYPSGMTWHSAILGPVFVLSLLFFDHPFIKCLVIFDVLICGNSTALVCVGICLMLQALNYLAIGEVRIKKEYVISILAILVAVVVASGFLNVFDTLSEAIIRLYVRLMDINSDASTAAHFGYFADYPTILKEIPVLQRIFGSGLGSSGYQYSLLYNRYTDLANWSVECDVIDILVSKGFVGFLIQYGFLVYIAIEGSKLDIRYLIFIIAILVGGIGYNIQFDYVLLISILLFCTIKIRINFFRYIPVSERMLDERLYRK